jgi:hypothetical protein
MVAHEGRSILARGDDVPICTKTVRGHHCGQRHHTVHGTQACTGHVITDRSTYDPSKPFGKQRELLPAPVPCKAAPMRGQACCKQHSGVAASHIAAGERREAERKMTEAARKLIPDVADRARITNPLETLLELASEANAFRESLRIMANELDGKIRYAANGGSGEQLRAEVATYRQALKDTTDLLVAIARLDIEKLLARIESRKVEFTLDALSSGVNEAGLTDDQKRAVMTGVARHLRLVRGSAA